MIAIVLLIVGLFVIGLFTSLLPVIITGLVISSVCFAFNLFIDISASIVSSLDKEAFEKGLGEKYDEKVQKKVKKTIRFLEIVYVILIIGNILLLVL